jgi:hypothetical protein
VGLNLNAKKEKALVCLLDGFREKGACLPLGMGERPFFGMILLSENYFVSATREKRV